MKRSVVLESDGKFRLSLQPSQGPPLVTVNLLSRIGPILAQVKKGSLPGVRLLLRHRIQALFPARSLPLRGARVDRRGVHTPLQSRTA